MFAKQKRESLNKQLWYLGLRLKFITKKNSEVRNFIDPKSCNHFYTCSLVSHFECPKGQLFYYEGQKCLNIGQVSTEADDHDSEEGNDTKKPVQRFIDPRNKRRYFECSDTPVSFKCPNKTVFNERSEICDWKTNVPRCSPWRTLLLDCSNFNYKKHQPFLHLSFFVCTKQKKKQKIKIFFAVLKKFLKNSYFLTERPIKCMMK